jgi:predicted Holliday junction resolvase-like endonuclease
MWQITQAKLLWIAISLLTLIAAAVAYQNTVHIREQVKAEQAAQQKRVEQERKAADWQRQMQEANHATQRMMRDSERASKERKLP